MHSLWLSTNRVGLLGLCHSAQDVPTAPSHEKENKNEPIIVVVSWIQSLVSCILGTVWLMPTMCLHNALMSCLVHGTLT
jgi:hypothetical protein